MKRLRFSLGGLLAFIVAAALGLAALSRPSCLAASAVFSVLLLLLTVAFFGAVYCRARNRAGWTGFLVCGSVYATLSLAPWFDSHVGSRLVTTAILDFLYPKVPQLENVQNAPYDPWKLWTGAPPDYSYSHPRAGFELSDTGNILLRVGQFDVNTTNAFLVIGHSLFALIAAIGGWHLAGFFCDRRASNES
jgi:hypothetical protein